MLIYSFLGKAVDEFLYLTGGYLVETQMSDSFVHTLGKLALTGVGSAFQIELRIVLKPFLGKALELYRRNYLSVFALFLE